MTTSADVGRHRPIAVVAIFAALIALVSVVNPGSALAAPTSAAVSAPLAATPSPAPASSSQLITVNSAAAGSSYATLSAWQRQRDGRWARVFGPVAARVGGAGIGRASEGSSLTPAGTFPLTQAFGRLGNPGTKMPYFRSDALDWWDENPASSTYNLHVRQQDSPGQASENLYYSGSAYNYAVNIGYNLARVPGAGSAFFLHVNTGSSTAGCVSIDQGTLAGIVKWLDPAQHPYMDIRVGAASTPTTPVAPLMTDTQAAGAVKILYPALYGRAPTVAEFRRDATVLQTRPVVAFANAMANSSTRYRNVVAGIFRRCEGSVPSLAARRTYEHELAVGHTLRLVYAQICRSDKTYAHFGGTDISYVRGLSREFAGAADNAILTWVARLHTQHRVAVIDQLASSTAFQVRLLDRLWVDMLGRHVDAPGRAAYARFMSDRGVFSTPGKIAGSAEFRRRLG